jgi:hypothetical protein
MVQVSKIGRCFAGACLIWLACSSVGLGVQPRYGGQQVTLGWNASWCIRQDLNLQPSDPKSEALSN